MSKLLHVLNVRSRIKSGMAVCAAFAPQFQHTYDHLYYTDSYSLQVVGEKIGELPIGACSETG